MNNKLHSVIMIKIVTMAQSVFALTRLYPVPIVRQYSKNCLKQPLKIDKTKVLKTNSSLMKVESIAECSLGAFCNTFDLQKAIIALENQFLVFFLSGHLRQVLLYFIKLSSLNQLTSNVIPLCKSLFH